MTEPHIYRGYVICPNVVGPYTLEWWHPDYDGAMDSRDRRSGFATSETDAMIQTDLLLAEQDNAHVSNN
jgi:hypothetical protein